MNVNPFSYLIEKLKGKVDKSGDTMSGQLRINNNSDTPLVIKKASSSIGKVYIGFENSAETIGYFSVGADKKPYFTSGNGADTRIALMSDIDKGSVSVTADGVKKYNELFNELFALVDMSKISSTSYMTSSSSNYVFNYVNRSSANIVFSEIDPTTNGYTVGFMILASAVSDCDFVSYTTSTAGTTSKISSANSVAPNGRKITLYY